MRRLFCAFVARIWHDTFSHGAAHLQLLLMNRINKTVYFTYIWFLCFQTISLLELISYCYTSNSWDGPFIEVSFANFIDLCPGFPSDLYNLCLLQVRISFSFGSVLVIEIKDLLSNQKLRLSTMFAEKCSLCNVITVNFLNIHTPSTKEKIL